MKKKLLVIIGFIVYLFSVGLFFNLVSLNINYINEENITLIDVPLNNLENINNDVVNSYIEKYNNEDVVGEIKIINTNFKKAIMQSDDNDYYLDHLEDKTSSYMGSIYLDFRIDIDNDDKLLIFGHNSGTIIMPFKILENYYSESYYKAHKYIQITTKNKIRLYEIYSVFVEVSDFDYMKTSFNSKNDWYTHIKKFKDNSFYETGVDINENDNILILQTCSTHSDYKMYEKKYLLVVAKEINSK